MLRGVLAGICAVGLIVAPASLQANDATDWSKAEHRPARRALVLGVSSYDHARQLVTPVNDALAAEKAFHDLRFASVDVVPGSGRMGRGEMIAAVRSFAAKLAPGDMAVVYFSGHGVQVDGVNYLVGSDGPVEPTFPGLEWVSVDFVVGEIARRNVGAALIVLDACRADPFSGTQVEDRDVLDGPITAATPPSVAQGLAPPGVPGPYILAFAAQPKMASYSRLNKDPPTASSIYTRSLVSRLVRNAPLRRALAAVDTDVRAATRNLQTPMSSSSAVYDLPMDGSQPEPTTTEEEWAYVIKVEPLAQQIVELTDFLTFHPLSVHAAAARSRLATIKGEPSPGPDVALSSDDQPMPPVVLGTLLGARSSADGTTAVTNVPVRMRERRNAGRGLGGLPAGAMVKLLEYKGGFARVLAADGRSGWIEGVRQADPGRTSTVVRLSFQGGDEYADVKDWSSLGNAAGSLSAKTTAVTVRTGRGGSEDAAQAELAGRLRALRIRDYVVRLGVPPERVAISQNDPSVSADEALVSVLKVVR